MDPFDLLPPELISHIISFTADFVGIESLLTISPRVSAVFYDRPGRSFQALLDTNSISSESAVQLMIQDVWLLHSSPFDKYLKCTDRADGEPNTDTRARARAHDAVVPKMMQISAQIQRLSCLCLSTMRQNFVNAVGRSTAGPSAGSVLAQKAARDFSWVEEANVSWALWHLRHYSDLNSRGSRENWPAGSAERFAGYRARHSLNVLHVEMISLISAILHDLGLSPIYSYAGLQEGEESTEPTWTYPIETPLPHLESFQVEKDIQISVWHPPPKPQISSVTISWCLGPDFCGRSFSYMQMYKMWTRQYSPSITDPRVHVGKIQLYRRLGIFIWDRWRMFSIGLIPSGSPHRIETPDGDFTEVPQSYIQWQPRWLALVQLQV